MPETSKQASQSRYGRLAAIYEWGAHLGSGGQIQASKLFHLGHIPPKSRVLYPGVGWGVEAAAAAKAGHQVTIVELDEAMLQRARQTFAEAGVSDKVECIHGSILDFDRPGSYDAVVINYLLDVFGPDLMQVVYKHLVRQVRVGGLLTLSGYAPLNGSLLHRGLQFVNHAYANLFCALTVRNAVHGIYDYARFFPELGLVQKLTHDFPMFGQTGPRFLRSWIAEKQRD